MTLPGVGGLGAERGLVAPARFGWARPAKVPRRSQIRGKVGVSVADVKAEIAANVWQVVVEVGATVAEGDELIILESMKMEIPVTAPKAGTVTEIRVKPEDQVQEGDVLAVVE